MNCDDITEQQKLKTQIEKAVENKATEVTKYIDPNITVNFAISVVPDAVYSLCSSVQVKILKSNVVLVSHSMFVPYLLLVFQTILKTSQNIDLQKLDVHLQSAQQSIKSMQEQLEGRFSKGLKMLDNSRNDMSIHLSKIKNTLTSLQVNAGGPATFALIDEPDSMAAD